jgi:hypothetical protein
MITVRSNGHGLGLDAIATPPSQGTMGTEAPKEFCLDRSTLWKEFTFKAMIIVHSWKEFTLNTMIVLHSFRDDDLVGVVTSPYHGRRGLRLGISKMVPSIKVPTDGNSNINISVRSIMASRIYTQAYDRSRLVLR